MPLITVVSEKYFDLHAHPGSSVGVHKVEINNATSNHLPMGGGLVDARVMPETRGTALPTFYIGGAGNKHHVAIDGATVGTRWMVVSYHKGTVNSGDDR